MSSSMLISDAFTQSDYAINITDPNGVLLQVNLAYLRLYKFASEKELLGQTQRLIRSPMTSLGLYSEMWATITKGSVWRGDLTNRAKDGSEVYIHLTISPIQREGKIVGYMGFAIDRAQQVLLERQLFHANKLVVLGTLGAGLAHELNNPLASILLDAEYLKDAMRGKGAIDKAAGLAASESVIRGAERMRRVLEHLLSYSKKDSGESKSTLSLRQLVEDSFLFIERQLLSRSIDLQTHIPEDALISGNRTRLESVLHNLIGNSRDAFAGKSIERKFISIQSDFNSQDGVVTIVYRDNAGGIPAEIIDRIFEPFFTTKGGEGTGLGLSISRQVIVDHGGSIDCRSKGGETTFTMILPAKAV